MTVDEMILKFRMELAEKNGQPAIKVYKKPPQKQEAEIRAAKPEIIAELQRRHAKQEEIAARLMAEREAELEGIKNGSLMIKLHYHDGEYLSGYTVHGQATKLLEEIGLGHHVSGWGFHVGFEAAEALGEEFTYAQALEYTRPAREAAEAKRQAKEAARAAKFQEARETGQQILLKKWTTDCCDPREECSLDIHFEYAMPDGSAKHEWTHTW